MVVIRSFGAKGRGRYKMIIKSYISCKTIFYSLFILFILPFPAWSTTYYVDATGGNDGNSGISLSTSWKTIAKVNSSNFNPGGKILFKGGRFGEGNLSFLLQDKIANRLSVSLIHLSRPDTFSTCKSIFF
jgi:hypothetical protein